MSQADSNGLQRSSSLSPDAAEFVPSGSGQPPFKGTGVQNGPMAKVPSYLTTCYPFVQVDQPPCSVNNYRWQTPGGSKQVMGGKQRPAPAPQGGLLRTPWAPSLPHHPYLNMGAMGAAGVPFDGGTAQGDGLLPTPVFPYTYPPLNFVQGALGGGVGVEMYGGARAPPGGAAAPKSSGKAGRHGGGSSSSSTSSSRGKSGGATKRVAESDHRPHTIIMKDISCQTDFSEEFADLTLSERPNLLFQPKPRSVRSKGSQRNISSDSEVDSDSGYSSPLIRRNLISNGTQPTGSFAFTQNTVVRATTATSPQRSTPAHSQHPPPPQHITGNTSANTSTHTNAPRVPSSSKAPEVPAPVTYAMMAQMKRTATVQVAMSQTHANQCRSSSGSQQAQAAPGSVQKNAVGGGGGGRGGGGGGLGEHSRGQDGGVAKSVGVTVSRTPSAKPSEQYSGVRGVSTGSPADHREVGGRMAGSQVVGSRGGSHPDRPSSAGDYPSLGSQTGSLGGGTAQQQGTPVSHSSPGFHHPMEVKSYSQVAASGRNWLPDPAKPRNPTAAAATAPVATATTAVSSSIQPGSKEAQQEEEEDGEKKKRRRRRNRRRNRQRDEGDDPSCADSGLSRTSTEVTLHFEDEEEFPDLGGHVEHGGPDGHLVGGSAFPSYSQALRVPGSPVGGVGVLGGGEEWPATSGNSAWSTLSVSSDTKSDSWQAVGNKESKNARKRRKRREMANQAADEELAEIGLEQQMLLGLQNKGPAPKGAAPAGSNFVPTAAHMTAAPGAHHQGAGEEGGRKGGIITHPPTVLEARAQHPTPAGKKSKAPIALDFGAMIDALEKKKEEPKKDDAKSLQAVKKDSYSSHKQARSLNVLDANAPAIKRGKERETPKPKKPSPLKKVILKEREEKKKLRLLDDDGSVLNGEGASVGVGVVNADSDLSQDGLSSKSSQEMGMGASTSADLSPISQTSPISMSPLSPGPSPLSSGLNSPITGLFKDANPAVLKIHSRRFREYCTQVLDKEIDECCTSLLQDLVRFQDRIFHRDPTKAKSRRRIVLGLREVSKHLKLRKIKCVVISPNLEKIQSKGGLDEALNNIINMCREQNIPFVFALGRRALGRACAKLVPVSVVGIFNFEGSESNYHRLIDLTQKAREAYKEMLGAVEREIAEFPRLLGGGAASGTPSLFAHMGHSRTPSGCSVISFTSSILSEPISENYPYSEPETDSKGYEIVRHPEKSSAANTQPRAVHEIDDGNEADTEDCTEMTRKVVSPLAASEQPAGGAATSGDAQGAEVEEEDDDFEDDEDVEGYEEDRHSSGASDTVDELPHIDSIHASSYDLGAEILSQHSVRTLENSEVMSTHSSRTVGDCGSATLTSDPERPRPDSARAGSGADNSSTTSGSSSRVRLMDKDRIQSWVDASQPVLLEVPEGAAQNEEDKSEEKEEEGSRGEEGEEDESEGSDAYESACDGETDSESVSNGGLGGGGGGGGDGRQKAGEAPRS